MTTVYKYPFEIADRFALNLPFGAEVLYVDVQAGVPCLWAKVNGNSPEPRHFAITGTGHPVDPGLRYVASFQMPPFVWHLWELPKS